jgi:hypothetical protein
VRLRRHRWQVAAAPAVSALDATPSRAGKMATSGGSRIMTEQKEVQGPASYFPSIEKKYGQPISHWMKLLDGMKNMKHMEMVAALKSKHAMGHGHANALVAYHRARKGLR